MEAKRLLFVWENNPELLEVFKKFLEMRGFSVDTKDNLEIALQDFKAGMYDLVILDLRIKSRELLRKLWEIDHRIKWCHLDLFGWGTECLNKMQVDPSTVILMPVRISVLEQKLNEILQNDKRLQPPHIVMQPPKIVTQPEVISAPGKLARISIAISLAIGLVGLRIFLE